MKKLDTQVYNNTVTHSKKIDHSDHFSEKVLQVLS